MPLFRRGDVILTSEPYAVAVHDELINRACSYCITVTSSLFSCHLCGGFKYCSQQCLVYDSPDHWLECSVRQRSPKKGLPGVIERLLIRMCIRYNREKERCVSSAEYAFGHRRTIHDLLSHTNQITEETRIYFSDIVRTAREFITGIYDFDKQLMFEMLAKMSINAHDMKCPRNMLTARVVYLAGSKVDHSCEVHDRYAQQFIGRTYVIRALDDVIVNGIEDLKINYLPLMTAVENRKEHLRTNYYFECQCLRCQYESHLVYPENFTQLSDELWSILGDSLNLTSIMGYNELHELVERFNQLPDWEYNRYRLLQYYLHACFDAGHLNEAMYVAMRMMSSGITYLDFERVMDKLCIIMRSLGWHIRDHPKFAEYRLYLGMAAEYFSTCRGWEDWLSKEYMLCCQEAI